MGGFHDTFGDIDDYHHLNTFAGAGTIVESAIGIRAADSNLLRRGNGSPNELPIFLNVRVTFQDMPIPSPVVEDDITTERVSYCFVNH